MISMNKEQMGLNSGFGFLVAEPESTAPPLYVDDGIDYYGAGQFVQAGCYIEVDGFRQIYLDYPGVLPASLDGRRALYRRLERPWITSVSSNDLQNIK